MKKAVFPGSFDPITLGHVDIINRGLELFDEVIIAIGVNADKKYLFSLAQREAFIANLFAHEPRIKVLCYEGLTADLCKSENAQYLLRGLPPILNLKKLSLKQMPNYKISKLFYCLANPNMPLSRRVSCGMYCEIKGIIPSWCLIPFGK
jgi:pantetheine-phosphate adenylyltransferase